MILKYLRLRLSDSVVVAQFAQPSPQRIEIPDIQRWRYCLQYSDTTTLCRLLRVRRACCGDDGATEKRDELASLHRGILLFGRSARERPSGHDITGDSVKATATIQRRCRSIYIRPSLKSPRGPLNPDRSLRSPCSAGSRRWPCGRWRATHRPRAARTG